MALRGDFMTNLINNIWNKFLKYLKDNKIIRPLAGRYFAGVCKLISNKTKIDVTLIRILWIISPFVTFGTALLIYVLCAYIIPSESFEDFYNDNIGQTKRKIYADDVIDGRAWEKK